MKYIIKNPFIIVFAVFVVINACKENKKKELSQTPANDSTKVESQGYDFTGGDERHMKKKLKEISGIHYLKDSLFAAVEDEDGKIFTVNFSNAEIVDELDFGPPGDYEDITMGDGFYYVLKSNGMIYKFPVNGDQSGIKKFTFPRNGNMEFETIYLDASGDNLIMICKSCAGSGKGGGINAYSFSIEKEQFNDESAFTIDSKEVARLLNEDRNFKPSAAAVHPIEKKLYVLCSVGKLLLVCDLKGKVEKVYDLQPNIYEQPEGIAFTPDGTLFISNEAVNSPANIIRLEYRSR